MFWAFDEVHTPQQDEIESTPKELRRRKRRKKEIEEDSHIFTI